MPGTRHAYCNAGATVAAYIVERITGQGFEDYIEQTFFVPLGMPSTSYFKTKLYDERGEGYVFMINSGSGEDERRVATHRGLLADDIPVHVLREQRVSELGGRRVACVHRAVRAVTRVPGNRVVRRSKPVHGEDERAHEPISRWYSRPCIC